MMLALDTCTSWGSGGFILLRSRNVEAGGLSFVGSFYAIFRRGGVETTHLKAQL